MGIACAAAFGWFAILLCYLSAEPLDNTQFLAIPLFVGGFSVLISNLCHTEKWSNLQMIVTALVSVLVCDFMVFLTGIDGLFCLLLSSPLAIATATCGAILFNKLAECFPKQRVQASVLVTFSLLVPLLMGFESHSDHQPLLRRVVSTIEIEAAPEKIWDNVIEYPQIDSELDFFFSAGVAYPIRSTIDTPERGGIRSTFFSTGVAQQRISAYEKNSLIVFDIIESPKPLIELSPFDRADDRHLADNMKARAGKIRLSPLDNGNFQLEYSLYYYQELQPQSYWSTVSDIAVGKIQKRIMQHIKELSEDDSSAFLTEK